MSVSDLTGPLPEAEPSKSGLVRTLAAIVEQSRECDAVPGGWFDKQKVSPMTVGINGCTYGGSVIRHDVVAAPGLFLEFANNVSTTRIKEARIVRHCVSTGDPATAPLPC